MDRECHYALVSQQLDNFTSASQRQLLDHRASFTDLFEHSLSHYPDHFRALLSRVREQYQQQSWRQRLDNIEQCIESCGARLLPIHQR